jgi:flagellar basal body L-ring protein FlgH
MDPDIDMKPPKYVEQMEAKEEAGMVANAGSLFGQGESPLYSDRKAMKINDIVRVVIKTETKDMSLAAGKPVSFDVSGKDKRTYLIKITNVKDEALTGTLAEIEIDFSDGTVKQNVISYDQNLFNNLKFISTEASGEPSEETDE